MTPSISRRSLLALLTALPLRGAKNLPIGLEMYSVRDALKKDVMGTVDGVAKLGYECVEFYAPYFAWTSDYARQVRAELDKVGLKCYSTHNGMASFQDAGLEKAMELNSILGARYIILASPGRVASIDDWKGVAKKLNAANEIMAAHGFHAGYHNHDMEWKPVEGQKPLEVLAANTDKSVVMQFDVGPCVELGNDPVAWIEKNPGRIKSLHVKDWGPGKGFQVLLGEGIAPWKKIFAAAEQTGGVEYYLIEQEGSEFSEMETAAKCLASFRKLHT